MIFRQEDAETWEHREFGANCWGGMAMDESRGIAYVATGSPKPGRLRDTTRLYVHSRPRNSFMI